MHGRNTTIWFPDEKVYDELVELAEKLGTSVSGILVELVKKTTPVIKKHQEKRSIPLDGVVIQV